MILDAKEGGVVYRELIPEYLDEVRTVSEGKHSDWRSCFTMFSSWELSCYFHAKYFRSHR